MARLRASVGAAAAAAVPLLALLFAVMVTGVVQAQFLDWDFSEDGCDGETCDADSFCNTDSYPAFCADCSYVCTELGYSAGGCRQECGDDCDSDDDCPSGWWCNDSRFGVCQRDPDDDHSSGVEQLSFEELPRVSGFNAPLRGALSQHNLQSIESRQLTVEQCAGLCEQNPRCKSFDYSTRDGDAYGYCYLGDDVVDGCSSCWLDTSKNAAYYAREQAGDAEVGAACDADDACVLGVCKEHCCGGSGLLAACTACGKSGRCASCAFTHTLEDGECVPKTSSGTCSSGEGASNKAAHFVRRGGWKLSNVLPEITGDFTLEFDAYIPHDVGEKAGVAFSNYYGETGPALLHIEFKRNHATMILADRKEDGTERVWFDAEGTNDVFDGKWHHYTILRSGSNVWGFVDGLSDFSGTATENRLRFKTRHIIGADHVAHTEGKNECVDGACPRWFLGSLDNFVMWGLARNPFDIKMGACPDSGRTLPQWAVSFDMPNRPDDVFTNARVQYELWRYNEQPVVSACGAEPFCDTFARFERRVGHTCTDTHCSDCRKRCCESAGWSQDTDEHCTRCSEEGHCNECADGWRLEGSDERAACVPATKQWGELCSDDSECESLPFFDEGGVCQNRCCGLIIGECAVCGRDGKCARCDSGHYLDDGGDCPELIEFGNDCEEGRQCLDSELCLGGVCCGDTWEHCLACDKEGVCSRCEDGYYVDWPECSRAKEEGESCDGDEQCSSGTCGGNRCCRTDVPDGCGACNSAGICTACGGGGGDGSGGSGGSGGAVLIRAKGSNMCLSSRFYFVKLQECNSANVEQHYQVLANGLLYSFERNRCMDMGPGSRPKNWMSVRTFSCKGFDRQIWTLRDDGFLMNHWDEDGGNEYCVAWANGDFAKHLKCDSGLVQEFEYVNV